MPPPAFDDVEDLCAAGGETGSLRWSPSPFSRCSNTDGEGVSAEWQVSPAANLHAARMAVDDHFLAALRRSERVASDPTRHIAPHVREPRRQLRLDLLSRCGLLALPAQSVSLQLQ